MQNKFFLILILFLLSTTTLYAQDKSNRGKEFWLAYGYDYSFFWEYPVNFQELALYISTEQAATVVVSITNTSYTQTLNIPANTVDASILIPKTGINDARTLTDGLQNRNIHIESNVPIAVYAHVYSTQVSGATMLMPVETNGYSYYSINYYQTTSQSSPDGWYSWFYVIASEDNTTVDITPSDTTKNGWLPNQTYSVNLNKGQSYHVFGKAIFNSNPAFASKDLTGTKIISKPGTDGNCHPIGVFSGSGGIRFCRGDGGEFMHQQVFPSQAWGTRYLTYHTINNTNTNITETNRNFYRICVLDTNTIVKKNGIVMSGLIKKFYYEYMDSTGGDYITADKPILIAQYTPNKNQCWNFPTTTPSPPSYGDPEMFYLSPIEQGQKSVLFYTSRKSTIDYVYVNILCPSNAVNSLKVDGNSIPASQIILHPNLPTYSVALSRLTGPAAQHTITCDSVFNATVYGLGNYESYGYNVGTLINNLNYYSEIHNTNSVSLLVDSFSCTKTPFKIFLKVAYPVVSIHWKLSQVNGISPNADSIITNPTLIRTEIINGRTYYIYSLQQDFIFNNAGTYYIPVTYSATVIPNCTQTESGTIKIVIKDGPKANFTYTNAGCLKDTVSFTGISNNMGFAINQYLWNFDDNTTANTINTQKKFNNAGTQNVRFRIYADNGCMGDTTKQLTINYTPIAKLGVTSTSCSGDSVLITDTSSISSGTITSWHYNFGDGSSITRTNNSPFYHTYTTAGNYRIKLVTTSNNNCISDTSFQSIQVFETPIAKFGYNNNICIGDSIKLLDSSTISNGNIVEWQWFFGDGQAAIQNNNNSFYHYYNNVGIYTIKLVTISNNNCLSDTAKLQVSVNNKPTASINYTGANCVDSLLVFNSSFTVPSTNPPTWYWFFGDGKSDSSKNSNISSHAYLNTLTNVTIKHYVSFGGSCKSDTSYIVIPLISNNPIDSFKISTDTLCDNKNIVFIATPFNNIASWKWQIGNFIDTTHTTLSYIFQPAGNYSVSLLVKNSNGCYSKPFIKNLAIHAAPIIDAGTDKTIITGTSTLLNAFITNINNYNFKWTPNSFLSADTILNPVTNTTYTIQYTIKATDKNYFCNNTDSVKIIVVNKLIIPNAFSPNYDGIHDTWDIEGLELYPDASVSIYTRGGQKIGEWKNYQHNPWNGKYKGKNVPVGAYAYIIQLNQNSKENIAGFVTLLR